MADTDKCGLNGCTEPVRRSVKVGGGRVTLTLCTDHAERITDRSANYDY